MSGQKNTETKRSYPLNQNNDDGYFNKKNNNNSNVDNNKKTNETIEEYDKVLPETIKQSEDLTLRGRRRERMNRRRSSSNSKNRKSIHNWVRRNFNNLISTDHEDGRGRSVLYIKLQYYYLKFRFYVMLYFICLMVLFVFVFLWNPIDLALDNIEDENIVGNNNIFDLNGNHLSWMEVIRSLLGKNAGTLTEDDFRSRSKMFHYEEIVQKMVNWMKLRDEQCSTIRHYLLNMSNPMKIDLDSDDPDDVNVVVIFTKNGGNNPIIMWNAEIENTYGRYYVYSEYSDFLQKKRNISRATGVNTRYTEWYSPNDYDMNKKYRSKSPDEARCILHCIDVNSAGKHLNTFLYTE